MKTKLAALTGADSPDTDVSGHKERNEKRIKEYTGCF